MSTAANTNAAQTFVCALSGQSPVDDAVATPSGYICSRKLLLAKLSENGGVDPFDRSTNPASLDESALVALTAGPAAAPPRAPSSSSLPSLLSALQGEFDAVLLELYDARTALDATRRELSSALYQNDAAVRVVARVARERDEARAQLGEYLRSGAVAGAEAGAEAKRPLEGGGDGPAQAAKRAKVGGAGGGDGGGIPPAVLDRMSATWKALSKGRRAVAKAKRTPEETAANEALLRGCAEGGEKKVNLGKSSSRAGVLCLAATADGSHVVSSHHDGTAVVYGAAEGRILGVLTGCAGEVTSLGVAGLAGGTLVVAAGGSDGSVRVYALAGGGDEEATLVGSAAPGGTVSGCSVHPASTADEPIVACAAGDGVVLYQATGADNLAELARVDAGKGLTAGALHPDGMIYVAGTDGGEVLVFDLKTLAVAGTLKSEDGAPVTSLSVSENGYHVASASSSSSDPSVSVWDLRKLKLAASVSAGGVGRVTSVSFDPTAAYLAVAGTESTTVRVAKDWDREVCALRPGAAGGKRKAGARSGGVVWGGSLREDGEGEKKVWIATGCDGERPVRFWGVE